MKKDEMKSSDSSMKGGYEQLIGNEIRQGMKERESSSEDDFPLFKRGDNDEKN